jgi:hypothetical protein
LETNFLTDDKIIEFIALIEYDKIKDVEMGYIESIFMKVILEEKYEIAGQIKMYFTANNYDFNPFLDTDNFEKIYQENLKPHKSKNI